MRFHALACDYDGTLAENGRVTETTRRALERVKASGRRLVLVTGRQLPDLASVGPPLELFDAVVAENGAVLFVPRTRDLRLLCEAPPAAFLARLAAKRVPFATGHAIVATWTPHETDVLETIRELGLELQVIFNKGAVMVLPSGVNKKSGLLEALRELGLSPHEAVAVGDAENDHALLAACECGVAVADAVDTLRQRADHVTSGGAGAGVVELADALVATDLRDVAARLERHALVLGVAADGAEVRVAAYGESVLLAGPSGSGKSNLATALVERLAASGRQYVVVDPEGDYGQLEGTVVLGERGHAPSGDEVLTVLARPERSAVVNLLGVGLAERPQFCAGLLTRFEELRLRSGRPHWIVLDEAHHLAPASLGPDGVALPRDARGLMLITVHPDHVATAVLAVVDLVVAVGEAPQRTLAAFATALGKEAPAVHLDRLEAGEAVAWRPATASVVRFRGTPPASEHRRHVRKYAQGELGPERSFYFRGPEGKLNLRAQNLATFLQIADGVDDATWDHHLRAGDYSRWFRDAIKDEPLAAAARGVEQDGRLSPRESRRLIRALVEKAYTAPA